MVITTMRNTPNTTTSLTENTSNENVTNKRYSVKYEYSGTSMVESSSGTESSCSEALYTSHNPTSRSLPYEIGRIYYINDIDDSDKHNEHILLI